MPLPPTLLKGSCLCSKTSFTSTKLPLCLTHCHCIPCRKLSGGPFTTWADFPSNAISWTPPAAATTAPIATSTTSSTSGNPEAPACGNGMPTLRRSSKIATRGFCESCGSTVSMQYDMDPDVLGR
ncbi:glutathione-dependent formaldehyde-activating protein superfamily domain-containing protein [Histoplasma ohiense]|nr:glutathione-dependent formaldehyde-activating protein superfamily domain-containing protein [Histoplasma ohiense (nom. inval.)]